VYSEDFQVSIVPLFPRHHRRFPPDIGSVLIYSGCFINTGAVHISEAPLTRAAELLATILLPTGLIIMMITGSMAESTPHLCTYHGPSGLPRFYATVLITGQNRGTRPGRGHCDNETSGFRPRRRLTPCHFMIKVRQSESREPQSALE
jgi:hypothetical protein